MIPDLTGPDSSTSWDGYSYNRRGRTDDDYSMAFWASAWFYFRLLESRRPYFLSMIETFDDYIYISPMKVFLQYSLQYFHTSPCCLLHEEVLQRAQRIHGPQSNAP